MKVLIVCSGNFPDPEKNFGIHQAFINDQMIAINKYHNVVFDIFLIKGKGLIGYFSNLKRLRQKIKKGSYDLIHAHFSLSGMITLIASSVPVVITFHGSDINEWKLNIVSSLSSLWADHVIFVSKKMVQTALFKVKSSSVIPCGVDFDLFYPQDMIEARKKEGMEHEMKYVLFSSAFDVQVKNYPLACRSVNQLGGTVKLVELKNRNRAQVRDIINGCDVLLITSFNEGSPLITKEAMACNCPVVTTDVGDVREVLADTIGCYITSYDPEDIVEKLKSALAFGKPTKGREKIRHLDNRIIAAKVFEVYKKVLRDER